MPVASASAMYWTRSKAEAVEGGVPCMDGGHGQGDSDMVPCARRTEEQDSTMLSHEAGGGQVQDEGFGHLWMKPQS